MCKYCESKSCENDIRLFKGSDEKQNGRLSFSLAGNSLVFAWNRTKYDPFQDRLHDLTFFDYQPINYCPMCGRKLRENDNNEETLQETKYLLGDDYMEAWTLCDSWEDVKQQAEDIVQDGCGEPVTVYKVRVIDRKTCEQQTVWK